jgi:hypothetical protein
MIEIKQGANTMKQLIYNTAEYYKEVDNYYNLIAKKLLLEKQIYLLGKQLDMPKEKSDRVCKKCGDVTNKFYDLEEKEPYQGKVACWAEEHDDPSVFYEYQKNIESLCEKIRNGEVASQ